MRLSACMLHVSRWLAAEEQPSWHYMQIGKLLGAKVVAVARGNEKCSLLSQLGADLVVDSVPALLLRWPVVSCTAALIMTPKMLSYLQVPCSCLCQQHVWPSCGCLPVDYPALERPDVARFTCYAGGSQQAIAATHQVSRSTRCS